MMRYVVSGLAAAAFTSAAMAQPPDTFGRQFAPSERNHRIGWRLDDRLAFLGQKLFFDARLSGTGTTACASCHDPGFAFAEPRPVSISDNGRPGAAQRSLAVGCQLSPHAHVGWPISLTRTASSKSVSARGDGYRR